MGIEVPVASARYRLTSDIVLDVIALDRDTALYNCPLEAVDAVAVAPSGSDNANTGIRLELDEKNESREIELDIVAFNCENDSPDDANGSVCVVDAVEVAEIAGNAVILTLTETWLTALEIVIGEELSVISFERVATPVDIVYPTADRRLE